MITYGSSDPVPAISSSHETLVIEVLTNNYIVKKVYVDPGSSVDVMYFRTFKNLKLTKEQLTPVRTPFVGFGGHVVHPEGMVTLMAASTSTSEPRVERRSNILSIDCINSQQTRKPKRLETGDEVEDIILEPAKPEQTVRVGIHLPEPFKGQMISLLKKYRDTFAWTAEEARPVKQKRRHFGPERNQAMDKEVDKLFPTKMIKEAQYPTWLSNPVMIKKDTGAWRMCLEFTDLNKACPKDCYPLPRVDALVDLTMGYEVFCFLDAFKGYHQIGMSEEDQEKISRVPRVATGYRSESR
ncbi:uncharacterized protein [Coffea arabica]|uniref:Reverse transcriptase domain-containing protein n=1 Tax=Coffea arabica TaxID=13443 RepID=A0ABM4VZC2_COFAR